MSRIDRLRKQNQETVKDAKEHLQELDKMAAEAGRVADVARDVHIIVEDLDRQFERATGLNGRDIKFLFFATALQVIRQYAIGSITARKGDKDAAEPIHKVQDQIFDRLYADGAADGTIRWYYAPLSQIIGSYGVPYDVVAGSKKYGIGGDGKGLSGFTHRSRTAGHDALLGWIFGTANILTNTMTDYSCINSFHVRNGQIIRRCQSTGKVLSHAEKRWEEEKEAVGAALVKQALHYSSDIYSQCGLPLPLLSKGISPEIAQTLAMFGQDVGAGVGIERMASVARVDLGNVLKVGTSAGMSILINSIIGMIHALYYDESLHGSLKLYSVRTRKILCYSNLIATVSNVVVVAIMAVIGAYAGNEGTVRKAVDCFDLGGLMVTVYRIVNDHKFIKEIKQEFLANEFYDIVMG